VEFNQTIRCKTATEAFEEWYRRLTDQGRAGFTDSSRDGDVIGEVINAVTVIEDPTRGIIQSKIRNMPIRYAVGELLWYLSGSDKVKDISQYSDVWERLSDDGEHVNSAYGHRIFQQFGFDQWEFVKQKLMKDPNSRQAVIHIKTPDNAPTKDMPCTVALQFFIREGKLYMLTYMRSNDLWMGFTYDVFSFTALQVKMAMELGVGLGTYTHVAGSLHLYKRDWKE
jgi:thymidylate synthase